MQQIGYILNSVVNFLNTNSGAILAITTLIYAIITGRMLLETKRMRQSQTEPRVFINIQPDERAPSILNLVIQNIGPGPAYDLRFTLEPDLMLRTKQRLSEINMMKKGFKYLAPNQKVECIVANAREEATKKDHTNHYITVYYKNQIKKLKKETFVLDFTEYLGLLYTNAGPYKDIIGKLDAIRQDIHDVIRRPDAKIKVVAYTKKEMEEEERNCIMGFDPGDPEDNNKEK